MRSIAIGFITLPCLVAGTALGLWRQYRRPGHHLSRESQETVKLGSGRVAAMFALVLGLLVMLSGLGCSQSAAPANELPAAPPIATNSPVAVVTNVNFQPLVGRWVRPDGGYVLEIKSAATNGQLDAGYFNQKPIHVAKAEASRDAAGLKVFVALQDVNYPGSTYTLTLDAADAQLKGIYYQAVARESYAIFFERMP